MGVVLRARHHVHRRARGVEAPAPAPVQARRTGGMIPGTRKRQCSYNGPASVFAFSPRFCRFYGYLRPVSLSQLADGGETWIHAEARRALSGSQRAGRKPQFPFNCTGAPFRDGSDTVTSEEGVPALRD